MQTNIEFRKIACVGNYLPRKCGLATFTTDVRNSLADFCPDADVFAIPVTDSAEGYDYPPEVRFEIQERNLDSYLHAADFLNFINTDVVCLQHEYGIYGGTAGSHILGLLRNLRAPVVTTLHTVLKEPNAEQRRVLRQVCEHSARVIVMTDRAQRMLREIYRIDESKIDIVAHGIPDMAFIDPNFYKDGFGVEGKQVLLTFGLLSPGKGIEHMIQAMPRILADYPNVVYVVLGATHPHLLREQGETYRESLMQMCRDLGVESSVKFDNRFVEIAELKQFIGAADIYVTPYLNPAQITSGTLAYSFGCGKAVVSTPYWHAEELLADGRGVLVPFADPGALATEISGLLRDEARRHAMRKKAYLLGRDMIWPESARRYVDAFRRARCVHMEAPPKTMRPRAEFPERPTPSYDHLQRMSDSTGMFQHATFAMPKFDEGYCTDDNARALMLTATLEELGVERPDLMNLSWTYAAFLDAAFDRQTRRFRNFMSFDRRWLESVGSPDSHARAVWALGACVGRSRRRGIQNWAVQLFDAALSPILDMNSPRSLAFGLLGVQEYLARLEGDRRVRQIGDALAARLVKQFRGNIADDWGWLEDVVTYDNARIAQALIEHGGRESVDAGLRALDWLLKPQRAERGHFRFVGCHGFFERGQTPACFDQQPLEAASTVSACLAAFRATGEARWERDAVTAFEWFLGRNDLGRPLYDDETGGCRDGLQQDRTNENQGAESTLAFLQSHAEMLLHEGASLTERSRATDRSENGAWKSSGPGSS